MLSVSEASGDNRHEYAVEKNPHREVKISLDLIASDGYLSFR